MLFDANAFEANVRRYSKLGDPDAYERFLLDEATRLNTGGMIAAGAACPAGKDEDALIADEAAFQANRNEGYILVYTELANLYRSLEMWSRCFDVHASLAKLIEEAGLGGTPTHLRILLNEAYARIDADELDKASALLDQAEGFSVNADDEVDPESMSRLHDARSVILFRSGDEAGASAASDLAMAAIREGARNEYEFCDMVMNHAASLAQMGDSEDAMRAIDELLATGSKESLPGDTKYQAMNLKAMIYYRAGDYRSAADGFAEMIGDAMEAGALSAQLSALCRNCSEMYRLAGASDLSERYRELSLRTA